ncbi:hypothetical protein MC885_017173 [Smutsia gigantea]|nr:hypothetical protein MC885_017173 [Smutsia gigantea]
MLFWHTQPEHYNQHNSGSYLRDVLALPIFKQEQPQLSPENEARLPPLQCVLCAATSPAVKLHEETLTYLNQGKSRGAQWNTPFSVGSCSIAGELPGVVVCLRLAASFLEHFDSSIWGASW